MFMDVESCCAEINNSEQSKMSLFEETQKPKSEISETKRKRKTRRGKRKNRKEESGRCHDVEEDSCEMCRDLLSECQYIYKNLSKKSKRKKNKRLLRPRYSPKAPCNYTSFIMDDHIENVDGYLSYESPESNFEQNVDDRWSVSPDYFSRLGSSDNIDSVEFDVEEEDNVDAFKSLDYMKNDFESTYFASRAEELAKLSKSELIDAICKMEDQAESLAKNLEESLHKSEKSKVNKMTMKQNMKLLDEEHKNLVEENRLLKSLLFSLNKEQW